VKAIAASFFLRSFCINDYLFVSADSREVPFDGLLSPLSQQVDRVVKISAWLATEQCVAALMVHNTTLCTGNVH